MTDEQTPKASNGTLTEPEEGTVLAARLASMRASLRENFGKAAIAMMQVPRYRAQTLADLQHLILDPMMSDRLTFAYPGKTGKEEGKDMAGFAIWASVSEEVDARIREQVANGVFPVRLKAEDWNSGKINWLLDVVAQDKATVASVIANFRTLADDGALRLHPIISRLVDEETLRKMGARKNGSDGKQAEPTE